MTDRFYVYTHTRPDIGAVFYVGKGTLSRSGFARASERAAGRNVWWRRVVAKCGRFDVDIFAVTATEALAHRLERRLIGDLRAAGVVLCNLTSGGEGACGLSPSQETRAKLRAAASGERHPNWGRHLSAETCRRKSASMRASEKNLRGKRLPELWRERIRATKVGALNPMWGRTGARHPLARAVVDAATGVRYSTVTAAAEAVGVPMKSLHNMLTGHRENRTSLRFA